MTPLLSDRGRLALAIYRRDFEAADHLLELMAARSPAWAAATIAARAKVKPLVPLPDVAPLALPVPGAAAGSYLGDDPAQRVRQRDPLYDRRDRAA